MFRIIKLIGLGGLFLFFLVTNLLAQRDFPFVGSRPVSMGTAFLAVADDANAVYWNPAGLGGMNHTYLYFAFGDFHKIPMQTYYASLIFPVHKKLSFGADWFWNKTGNDKLKIMSDQFHLAFGLYLTDWMRLGVSAKLSEIVDGFTKIGKSGCGYNLGLLFYPPLPGLKLGAMIHDDFDPQVMNLVNLPQHEKYRNFRIGLSYNPGRLNFIEGTPFSNSLLSLDYDLENRLHGGLEFKWSLSSFQYSIRFGMRDIYSREHFGFTAGIGITLLQKKSAKLDIDYGYMDSKDKYASNHFGATLMLPPLLLKKRGCIETQVCHHQIKLDWWPLVIANPFSKFVVERKKISESSYTVIYLPGTGVFQYTNVGLDPGTTYAYWIYEKTTGKPECKKDEATTNYAWKCAIEIKHTNNVGVIKKVNLTFGLANTAVDGFDPELCEDFAVIPNPTEFDALFKIPTGPEYSLIDFRMSSSTNKTWDICLYNVSGRIDISWQISPSFSGKLELKDVVGLVAGGNFVKPMNTAINNYSYTNTSISKLRIEYTAPTP